MVIKSDLRNPEKYKSKTDAETSISHYLVFTAAASFVFTIIVVIILGIWITNSIDKNITIVENQKSNTIKQLAVIDKKYELQAGTAQKTGSKIQYILSDIPSIEILTALDTILPSGASIESISITDKTVEFKGTTLKEDDVLLFVNNLSIAPFVSSAGIPIITENNTTKNFLIACNLKSLSEIMQNIIIQNPDVVNTGDKQ